jgi:hypothetical protein
MQRETEKALLSKIESAAAGPTAGDTRGAFRGQGNLGKHAAPPDTMKELLILRCRQ